MNKQEWQSIAYRMVNMWPSRDFDADKIAVYYDCLGEYDAEQVAAAIRSLSKQGARFIPSVGEIEGEIGAALRSTRPTFDEAYNAVLPIAAKVLHGWGPPDPIEALREQGVHRYAIAWVEKYGLKRLAAEQVNDLDHGAVVLRRLEESYERSAGISEIRERHGLLIDDRVAPSLPFERRRELVEPEPLPDDPLEGDLPADDNIDF